MDSGRNLKEARKFTESKFVGDKCYHILNQIFINISSTGDARAVARNAQDSDAGTATLKAVAQHYQGHIQMQDI